MQGESAGILSVKLFFGGQTVGVRSHIFQCIAFLVHCTQFPDQGQDQMSSWCDARFDKYIEICRRRKNTHANMKKKDANIFGTIQICAGKPDQGQVQMGSCWDANSGKEGARRLMPPSNFNRNHWNKDIDMCKYHFTFCKLKTTNILNFYGC